MRELIQAEQALGDYTRKHARHILAGVLGNNAGTVDHATRTNFVYVRLHGDKELYASGYDDAALIDRRSGQ